MNGSLLRGGSGAKKDWKDIWLGRRVEAKNRFPNRFGPVAQLDRATVS